MKVKIDILHALGFPNIDVLNQRLREALGDCPVVVTHRVVTDVTDVAVAVEKGGGWLADPS